MMFFSMYSIATHIMEIILGQKKSWSIFSRHMKQVFEDQTNLQMKFSIIFQLFFSQEIMIGIQWQKYIMLRFFMPWRLMWCYLFSAKHNDWKDLLNIKVQSIFRVLPINFLKDENVMKDCIFVFVVHYFIFFWFACC